MATIARMAAILSVHTDEFAKGLTVAARQAEAWAKNVSTLLAATAGGTLIGTALALFRAGVDGIKAAFEAVRAVVETVAGAIKSAAEQAFALGKSAVETAAAFEQTEIAFTGLLGGQKQSADFLERIAKFAAVTPFTFQDLAKATQQMMAFGFSAEDAFFMIQKLGDLSASAPQGAAEGLMRITVALGQIRGAGRVTGEEMRQLVNANIPAWEALAKQLGVTQEKARDLSEKGLVSARDGILAILSLANDPRFAGGMERQSRGLLGLWSTIKDNAQLTMRALGDSLVRAFDIKGLENRIISFLEFLKNNIKAIEGPLRLVGAAFSALLDVATIFAVKGVDSFAKWLKSIDSSPAAIARVRDTVLDALLNVGTIGIEIAGRLTEAFKHLAAIFTVLTAGMVEFAKIGGAMAGSQLAMFAEPQWAKDAKKALSESVANARKGIGGGPGGGMPGGPGGAPAGFLGDLQSSFTKLTEGTETPLENFKRKIVDLQRTLKDAGPKGAELFRRSWIQAFEDLGAAAREGFSFVTQMAGQVFEQTRTPLEKFEDQVNRLRFTLAAEGPAFEATFGRGIADAADKLIKLNESTFKTLAPSALQGSREAVSIVQSTRLAGETRNPVELLKAAIAAQTARQTEQLKEQERTTEAVKALVPVKVWDR